MEATGYKQAAERFDSESVRWDNQGPTIRLSNGGKAATCDPSTSISSNWKHARADRTLSAVTIEGEDEEKKKENLYEFTIQMDSLRHAEIVIGVVDPKIAPKTPFCLHGSKPKDGVYIHFFSFNAVQEGDFLTALIDLNSGSLTYARNGTRVDDIKAITIPCSGVVPVIELYGHDHPSVSLIQLPFMA